MTHKLKELHACIEKMKQWNKASLFMLPSMLTMPNGCYGKKKIRNLFVESSFFMRLDPLIRIPS